MRLGTADVLVRAKTDQYQKDLKTAETRTETFGKNAVASVTRVSSSFLALAGVGGVGALSVSMVKAGADFELQMATVQGVMRASQEDLQRLKDAAKEWGEQTEWSARQSGEALNYMGMAGWDVNKSIASLPAVLNLATAANMDLGQASDIVTDSLTAMGMGVEDLSRFNDVLTGTTTRSNTTITMMGESLKYSAPIARQYGMDIETLSAMIGTLANAGIKASDSGTDLRQAMVRNKKAAKELGTAEDDLIGTLKAAKAAGWGVNEVTENYGMIASKSVLVLMDQIDAFERLKDQLYDVQGETDKLAKTKLDTLTGDFKILMSTIEDVRLAAHDHIEGDLRQGVQDLTVFIRENKEVFLQFADDMKDVAVNIGGIAKASTELLGVYQSMPEEITGPASVGIVGAILFGGAAGKIVFTVALINESLSAMGNGLGDLVKKHKATNEAMANLWQSIKYELGLFNKVVTKTIDEGTEGWAGYVKEVKAAAAANNDLYDADFGSWSDGMIKATNEGLSATQIAAETSAKLWKESHEKQYADFQKMNSDIQAGMDAALAYEIKTAEEKSDILNQFTLAHERAILDQFEFAEAQLKKEYALYSQVVTDKKALEEWFSAEKKKIEEARTDAAKKELEKEQKAANETWQHTLDGMQDSFYDFWGETLRGGQDSFSDFCSSIIDLYIDMTARMLAYDSMSLIFGTSSSNGIGLFSGGTSGGGIFGNISGLDGSGGFGVMDLLSAGNSLWGAFSGSTSSTVANLLMGTGSSYLIGTSATAGIAAANTAASLGIGSVGTIANAAGVGASTGSIASILTTAAPYLAIAAAAVPIIMDLFENDPTPAIGLSFGPNPHDESGIINSNEGYNYYSWLQDIGGREETGEAIISYYDALFSGIDAITEFSIKEALAGVQYGTSWDQKAELDLYGGDVEAAMAALTDKVFGSVSSTLVEALVGTDISGYFGVDFFETIQSKSGYDNLFESYAEFAAVVEGIDDFTTEFTRQVGEFGEAAYDAYQNVATIYTILEEVDAGLTTITSVSSITAVSTLTDTWNDLITTLEEANATTEQISGTQSAMAQVLGANITGLTADSITSALMSGQSVSDLAASAVSGAAYAAIAQTIADSYLTDINAKIGQAWIDSGGDMNEVIFELQSIDLTDLEADIFALKQSMGMLEDEATEATDAVGDITDGVSDLSDASRIVSLAINGQLTAAEQFAEWQIENAEALSLYARMADNGVTRGELEGAVQAFSDLGLEGDQLNTVIEDLADRFVDASERLQQSIEDIEDAQRRLTGNSASDYVGEIAAAFDFFRDIPSWSEIYGTQTIYKEVFDEPAYKSAFESWAASSNYFDKDAYEANKLASINDLQIDGHSWTKAEMLAAFASLGLTSQEHYEMFGKNEGILPYYDLNYFGGIEAHFKQYGSTISDFISSVSDTEFLKTVTATVRGEISTSRGEINDAMETIQGLSSVISGGVVNEAALEDFTSAIASIDPAVLDDIYGADAADQILALADAQDAYFDAIEDNTSAVSDSTDAQSEYLRELENLCDATRRAADDMREFREGIWTGSDSPYDSAIQKSLLYSQMSGLYDSSMTGDTDSIHDFTDIAGQYLSVVKDSSATWLDYQREAIRVSTMAAEIEAYATDTASDLSDLYGFADGGIVSGPKSGYPVELHGTEMVTKIDGPSSFSSLLDEVRELRAQVRALTAVIENGQTAIAKHTSVTASKITNWDKLGQPPERQVG